MFYQETKTAKAAAIGTIMPWTGGISEIPAGWIYCNGQSVSAKDFPLLVQVIGDVYTPTISDLVGTFPNYGGSIYLPNLNNKALMDVENRFFGGSGYGPGTGGTSSVNTTGRGADKQSKALNTISPYIGTNSDVAMPIVFNDVTTAVNFTLNDRNDYGGSIAGATIQPGDDLKSVYIYPRKLSREHLRGHSHSGSYETLVGNTIVPGRGVIPWADNTITLVFNVTDPAGGGSNDTYTLSMNQTFRERPASGIGQGRGGRVIGNVDSESPPVNLRPNRTLQVPFVSRDNLASFQPPAYGSISSTSSFPYAIGGNNVTLGAGQTNYYSDSPGSGNFGTTINRPGYDFLQNINPVGQVGQVIESHDHEEFDVIFDTGNLEPQNKLNVTDATISATTVMDNSGNQEALQINLITSQPGMSCIYIIRAY